MQSPRSNENDAAARFARVALSGALLGAFASAYLLVDYVFGSGICLTGSGCDLVRASPFAYPLGVPTPLLGLAFYLTAIGLFLVEPRRTVAGVPIAVLRLGWALLGLAVMAILTFIELVVIGAVCSWCLLSAVASVLLAAGAIASRRPEEGEQGRSSRARRRLSASADDSRRSLRRFAAIGGGSLGIVLAALLAVPALTGAIAATDVDPALEGRPRLGDGPVEVGVFSDFQCPACAVAAPILSDLAEQGEISLVYRYFPLISIHPNATAAAEAAQAAALQGRFWEFHDALFASQDAWAELPASAASAAFEAIAADLGLDTERWRGDAGSAAVRDLVAVDRREAERLGLPGTPTIFIDGTRYSGTLDRAELLRAVDAARG